MKGGNKTKLEIKNTKHKKSRKRDLNIKKIKDLSIIKHRKIEICSNNVIQTSLSKVKYNQNGDRSYQSLILSNNKKTSIMLKYLYEMKRK